MKRVVVAAAVAGPLIVLIPVIGLGQGAPPPGPVPAPTAGSTTSPVPGPTSTATPTGGPIEAHGSTTGVGQAQEVQPTYTG